MADPMRKELANVRKKIDMVNRELKPLGLSCQKKVLHALFSKTILQLVLHSTIHVSAYASADLLHTSR